MRTNRVKHLCMAAIVVLAVFGLLYVMTDDMDADAGGTFHVDGGIEYYLDDDTHEATVFSFKDDVPEDVSIPSVISFSSDEFCVTHVLVTMDWTLTHVVITSLSLGDNIRDISNNSFANCSTLRSVTFGSKVSDIGFSAFRDCTSLSSITFNSRIDTIGDSAFHGCTSLMSVDLSAGVGDIKERAFYECSSIRYIILPGDVEHISNWAFQCPELEFLSVKPNENWGPSTISYNAFSGLIFSDIYGLEISCDSTDFDGNDYILYPYASRLCQTIRFDTGKVTGEVTASYLTISERMVVYGKGAMRDWEHPDDHYLIGGSMVTINELAILDGVTSVGDHSFEARNLKTVKIADSVEHIGDAAFRSSDIESIELPDNLESIGDEAFSLNPILSTVYFNEGLTYIGNGAFRLCNLSSLVYLPDSLEHIGAEAFSGCYGLTEIVIPCNVSSIGELAIPITHDTVTVTIYPNENWNGKNKDISRIALDTSLFNVDEAFFYSHSGCYYEKSPVGPDEYILELKAIRYFIGKTNPMDMVALFDTNSGHLTISGTGEMKDWSITDMAPWQEFANDHHDYSAPITTLELNVPDIGDYAFVACTYVNEIYFPSCIATISENSFLLCTKVSKITVESNENWNSKNILCYFSPFTFYYAYGETIQFGDERFAGYTYSGSSNYTLGRALTYDVGFPSSSDVKATLTVHDGTMNISATCLSEMVDYADPEAVPWKGMTKSIIHLIVGDNVLSIGDNAFYGCGSLEDVILGNDLYIIGDSSFRECYILSDVSGTDSVSVFRDRCFYSCVSLTSIIFSNLLQTIGDEAFAKCQSFIINELPSGVEFIGNGAFYDCNGTTSLTLGGSIQSIGDNAFSLKELTELKVRNDPGWNSSSVSGTAFIGWTFYNVMGSEIKFNDKDFDGNSYAKVSDCVMSVVISFEVGALVPADVIALYVPLTYTLTIYAENPADMMDFSISTPAPWFGIRDKIDYLVIEEDVRSLGAYAFYMFTDIFVSGADPSGISLHSNVFDGVGGIYVGEGRLLSYRTSWSDYASIIFEVVSIPEAKTDIIYNGSPQYGVDTSKKYLLIGDYQATDAGTYDAMAVLLSGYCWEDLTRDDLTITWSMEKAMLESTCLKTGVTFTYSGLPNVPKYEQLVITAPGNIASSDVNIAADNCVNAGTAIVTVTARSDSMNYKGSVSNTYTIDPKAISKADFTVDTGDETYDGKAKTKTVTSSLVLDKDYSVAYSDNIHVGTATVTISGKGNYTGTLTYNFVINKLAVAIPDPLYYIETGQKIEFKDFPESPYFTETTGNNRSGTDAETYAYKLKLNSDADTYWADPAFTGDYYVYITVQKKDFKIDGVTIAELDFFEKGVRKDGEVNLSGTHDVSSETKAVLKDVNGNALYSYDIKIIADGKEIQPAGKVTVRLLIPEDITSVGFDIYHIHNGVYEKVNYSVEGQYAVFTIDSFSEFVFMKDNSLAQSIPLIVILGISALVALLLMGVYLIRKH